VDEGAEQPPASRAERDADRKLALPRRRAPREHRRDVRARDEQHEEACRKEDPQRRPHGRDELFLERRDRAAAASGRMAERRIRLTRDALGIRARLSDRHAGREARDEVEPALVRAPEHGDAGHPLGRDPQPRLLRRKRGRRANDTGDQERP